MQVSNMPFFLQKNVIDGFIAWAPHPAEALEHKFGHELFTSHDLMPNHQCCVLVTKESIVQNDPETVSKLLKVYLDAYKWFLDNQEESIRLAAKNTGVGESVVRRALKTVKYPYPPYCNVASMQSMAQSLVETGRITTVKEADLAPFIKSLYRSELLEKTLDSK
jgi:NitT/TauT family transport system substrate-binding protein